MKLLEWNQLSQVDRNTKMAELGIQIWTTGNRYRSVQALLESNHKVKQIVVGSESSASALKDICSTFNVPIQIVGKGDHTNVWNKEPAQLMLSIGFPQIVPASFLEKVPLAINIHPSLLPKYRGRSAIVWGIVEGDKECGLTAHLMNEGIDTGDILRYEKIPLTLFDTPKSLLNKLFSAEPALALEVLKQLTDGTLVANTQEDGVVQQYENRKPSDGEIDPSKSLLDLFDSIRASDPDKYPAYFFIEGQKVCIKMWRPDKGKDDPSSL